MILQKIQAETECLRINLLWCSKVIGCSFVVRARFVLNPSYQVGPRSTASYYNTVESISALFYSWYCLDNINQKVRLQSLRVACLTAVKEIRVGYPSFGTTRPRDPKEIDQIFSFQLIYQEAKNNTRKLKRQKHLAMMLRHKSSSVRGFLTEKNSET